MRRIGSKATRLGERALRAINAPALAALSSPVVPMALLIEMQLSVTLRFSTANMDLNYAGGNFLGLGMLGTIEEVDDSPGEYKNLVFTLGAVAVDVVSIALSERIRNKPVILRLAVIDTASATVLDAPTIWTGALDQMPMTFTKETVSISVTAEHRGVTFARAKPLYYTDIDQRKLVTGDTSLKTIQSQSTHQDVWPSADWFKQ